MNHIVATLLLISVTIVWGWSFVLVKDAIAIYGVMSFLTVRFIVAGLVMAPYSARRVTRSSLAVGIPIGLVLSAVFVTQTFGLQWTTATNSGLITGLFVVFAPMANRVMFGVRTRWLSWAAIAISFVGLALLTGSGPDRLNVGDLLHFTSTMAVVEVDGEKDEAKAALVANTANGIRTSELFEKLTPAQDEEETEEDDG